MNSKIIKVVALILTLRDPPRPGPAHPREHGDWTPSNKGWVEGLGFRVYGLWFGV